MPRRKRAAWGSLTKVDDGTWRIRFWGKGPDGQYRRRSCTVRGTRKDAERRRAELMLAHSDDAPCPTVGDVWRSYALPDMERRRDDGDVSASTVRKYASAWERVVSSRWGAVQCDAIRPLAVQQWLDSLTRSNAIAAMNVLRPIGDYAVRYGLVATNPMRERYLMPSKSTVRERDKGIWTLDGLRDIWQRAYGEWWEAAFLLAAFGGLRVGESLGVHRSLVSESHGCAMASVEMQVAPNGPTDRLKTPQSRRVVPIPGIAGRRVIELAASSDGYLGGDGMGNPSKRRTLDGAWAASDAGHPFANLRPSWQTWMRWEMRVPPWAIEVAMGHIEQSVTGRHYDRPQSEVIAEVIADAYAQRPYDSGWTVGR